MKNPVPVEDLERFEQVPEKTVELFRSELGSVRVPDADLLRERAAFHIRHRNIGGSEIFEPAEDPDDSGVIKGGDRFRFFSEIRHGPREEFVSIFPRSPGGDLEGFGIATTKRCGEVLLENEALPEFHIAGEIGVAETAAAEHRFDDESLQVGSRGEGLRAVLPDCGVGFVHGEGGSRGKQPEIRPVAGRGKSPLDRLA